MKPSKRAANGPKKKRKRLRTNIKLVTRNGVLIALTPADVRRQQPPKSGGQASEKKNKKPTEQLGPRPASLPRRRSRAKAPSATSNVVASARRAMLSLPNRSLPELRQMWLNLVSQMAKSKRSPPVPAHLGFRDALVAEWSRRAVAALRAPDRFEWPTTEAEGGDGTLVAGKWPGEGMLSFLGYRVGVTQGLTEGARRHILDVLFGSPLPPINGPAYMGEWGASRSAPRLKKLADTLASLARNAKRKKAANMDSAIADWERDLRYLYDEYYVGRFAFAWPSIGA